MSSKSNTNPTLIGSVAIGVVIGWFTGSLIGDKINEVKKQKKEYHKKIMDAINDPRRMRMWIDNLEHIYGGDQVGYIIYSTYKHLEVPNLYLGTERKEESRDKSKIYRLYAVGYRTITYTHHCAHCTDSLFCCHHCYDFDNLERYTREVYSSESLEKVIAKYISKCYWSNRNPVI